MSQLRQGGCATKVTSRSLGTQNLEAGQGRAGLSGLGGAMARAPVQLSSSSRAQGEVQAPFPGVCPCRIPAGDADEALPWF